LTDPIREMILEKKPASEVRKLAQQRRHELLRESALDRVRRGFTTLKEINKVTFIEAAVEGAGGDYAWPGAGRV
jgi:type II secretory ATPase GspE/PulE/Tfp pilus assembly ATPase PilB-like protein